MKNNTISTDLLHIIGIRALDLLCSIILILSGSCFIRYFISFELSVELSLSDVLLKGHDNISCEHNTLIYLLYYLLYIFYIILSSIFIFYIIFVYSFLLTWLIFRVSFTFSILFVASLNSIIFLKYHSS